MKTHLILLLTLTLSSCGNQINHYQLTGKTFQFTRESSENPSKSDFKLEFVNDSMVIRNENMIYSDRWSLESDGFGTDLILTSPFDTARCSIHESNGKFTIKATIENTTILGKEISSPSFNTNDIIGAWKNDNDTIPPPPAPPGGKQLHSGFVFKPDGTYKIVSFPRLFLSGTWSHSKTSSYILLNGGTDYENIIQIQSLDPKHFTIHFRGETLELSKSNE